MASILRALSGSLVLALALIVPADLAWAQVRLGTPSVAGGGTAVNPGDVYGIANFELRPGDGLEMSEALDGLLRSIINSTYSNREGSYLLTIEASRAGERLVVQPIISVSYSSERFLFIETSSAIAQNIYYSGTLLNTPSIVGANNEITISVRSYFKGGSSFDLSVFDLVNSATAELGLVGQLDSIGITSGVLSLVRNITARVLAEADQSDDLYSQDMHFAQLGSVDDFRVRSVTLPIQYQWNRRAGSLQLYLRTWSVSSRFLFEPLTGKFVNPRASVFLNQASVNLENREISALELAGETGSRELRAFLSAVFSPTGYTGDSAYSECARLLAFYAQHFSNRDALAVFWATISEHRDSFRRSRAGDCISGRREELEALGLPADELVTYLDGG